VRGFIVPENYKISFVITDGDHPGAILNTDHRPEIGDRITLGKDEFTVLEVIDLMPARGDFNYLHVSLKMAEI
jgi:hypothetical protein